MKITPRLIETTVIFSIGWILFFVALNLVQSNGVFTLDMWSVAFVFLFALGYNFVLSLAIPGRYR